MQRSCSLPALTKAPERAGSKSKAAVCRVRLDGLPLRHPADRLEDMVHEILEHYDVACPAHVEVALDPISLRPRGHAFVDFPSPKEAEAAGSTLRLESNLCVSVEVA